jgi:hypothetical protein
MAHLESNLLTVASGLNYHGSEVAADEEMSPTTERLAVYLWLTLIDARLPAYISRVYAHDLQTQSLKDIQPQLSDSMDSLLQDLATQEEISVQYSSTKRRPFQRKPSYRHESNPSHRSESKPWNRNESKPFNSKSCTLCQAAGRPHQGHDISKCWFISKFEKLQIAKALQVEVNDYSDFEDDNISSVDMTTTQSHTTAISTVQKVQCDVSPYFYAFYQHHPCHIVIDTGATSSLISKTFLMSAGIPIKPTRHSARTVDKSPIGVRGEVHITLSFANSELPITALVMDSLDCDILAGVPFCKENDVEVHLKGEEITLHDIRIPYRSKPKSTVHEIYRSESFILRNENASKVILPGEFVEIHCKFPKSFEGEVAIEPRSDSPHNGEWPEPEITRVIQSTIRIPNNRSEPVALSRLQHFAQIRRVFTPDAIPRTISPSPTPQKATDITKHGLFSDAISIDPDNQLDKVQLLHFRDLHKCFDNVFNSNFGVYNDTSGTIRAKINMGAILPPPRKGRLPFYN